MPIYSIEGPDGKTYSIEGPAGATREEVIRAIQMRMQPVAAAPEPERFPMPVTPTAAPTQRSFGEAALDIPAAALSGLGGLLQFPGQVVKMLPGLTGVGQALEKPGELVSEAGDYLKSEGLKAREALRSKAISEAEKDGILSAFGTAIVSTIKDPALITTFLAEQVPLLLGPAGAAKLTQKLGAKAVESAGAGLTGDAAKEAVKVASEKLSKKAYGAAYGTGAAMQAADVSSDAYEEALRKAREMGLSEDEAQSKALAAGRIAGLGAGSVALLAQRLPGAKAIEQRLAGVPGTAGKLGSAVGEGISEAIEEGGGQVFKNLGLRQIDPNQSLTEGVGGAAGLGALGGGMLGGILGKKAEEARFEGQREGESDREFAARLQREIQQGIRPPAPPPAPPKIPTDQQLFTLAAQPNGYGLLENLKQRLDGDQTITEADRKAAIDNIASIQERMTTEEIGRKRVTPGAEERFLRPEILNTQQLFDMASQEGGYGQLESYKQNLLQGKQDAEIKNTVREIEDLQRRMNIEQAQRLIPGAPAPTLEAQAPAAPAAPQLLTTNELFDMASKNDYGGIEQYKQGLKQERQTPEVRKAIEDAEFVQRRMNVERIQPSVSSYFEGKDLNNQEDVDAIAKSLYSELKRKDLAPERERQVRTALDVFVNSLPETVEAPPMPDWAVEVPEKRKFPKAEEAKAEEAFRKEIEKKIKEVEVDSNKLARESKSLFATLKGTLNPKEVFDISPDRRVAGLKRKGAGGVSLDFFVDSGRLDAFLPPDMRHNAAQFDSTASQEYIKDLIRQGVYITFDARMEIEKNQNSVQQMEKLLMEFNTDELNALLQEASDEQRAEEGIAEEVQGAAPEGEGRVAEEGVGAPPAGEEVKPEAAEEKPAEKPAEEAPKKAEGPIAALKEEGFEVVPKGTPERYRDSEGTEFFTMQRGPVRVAIKPNEALMVTERGMVLRANEPGNLTISAILVDPEARGEGHARRALESITKAADQFNVTLYVEPVPLEDKPMSQEQLNKFYQSLGFTPLPDSGGKVMLREPEVLPAVEKEAPKALEKPEGEVIDVEARVIEETLGPKVAALPAPQIATLEKHYGVSKDSPTFLQRIKEDVVLYATKGGKAVAAIIRPIIRNLHAAVLSLAVIFNPTNISTAEAVIFDKQVITETKDIRVAPPESVASKMSDGAKEAYSILYPSIKDQLQRDNKLMLIVDKPNARMFVFTPDGQPLLDKKVLLGKATGDLYKGNNDLPQNRVTPAGLFKMGLRDADRSIGEARTAGEYDFKKVFVLDKAIEGEYSVTLFHSVWLKESDAALRAKALKSESATDSRYSFGCINVDKQTYERLITDHLNQMDGASLFIVPDNAAATAEFLTGATAQNVSGADGLTRTTFTPAKETTAYEVKRAGRPGELMREVSRTPVKKSLAKVAKGVPESKFKELERRAKAAPEVKAEEAPKEEAPAAPEISPEIQAKIDMLKKVLQKNLSKFGLKDVDLNLEQGMADEGSFSGQLIRIALDSPDPLGILRHESIHALKEAGFFTDKQWASLEKAADEKWIDQFLKGQQVEYEGQRMSRFDAYMKEYGGNMALIREEAIADAFRSFSKKKPAGLMGALTERMKNFFKAVKSAFNSQGFESAEDIFGKIEEGKLEAAPVKAEGVERRASLRTSDIQKISKAPEAECFSNARKYASDNDEPGTFVVHGKVNDINGKVIDHAWVERNESVIDPTAGVIVPKNVYYPQVSAIAESVYTPEQASINSVRTGNQGPWTAKEVGNRIVERKSLRAPDTEAFKKWFGDSKVVDENGDPLVVYHATDKKFDAFDMSYDARGNNLAFFSDNKESAQGIIKNWGGKASRVIEAYLSIQKPFDTTVRKIDPEIKNWIRQNSNAIEKDVRNYDSEFGLSMFQAYLDEKFNIDEYINSVEGGDWQAVEASPSLINELRRKGYDGIKMYEDGGNTYAIFKNTQVKSATGNIGTFEPTSPDIRKSLRATETKAFDDWFKGSKIVDNNGKPRVMYHGTPADFDEFKPGSYVTTDPDYAAMFGDRILPVYVSASKIKTILDEDFRMLAGKPKQIQKYIDAGFDALASDSGSGDLIILKPEQVKSAIGNVGTYNIYDKDIRKSLRSMPVINPDTRARINETIRPRKKEGFVERIIDAISAKTFSRFREELINHYNEAAELDKRVAAEIKAAGGAEQMANEKAEVAALFSDQAAAVASSALGAHNRKGGIPVYRNGIVTVDTSGDNEGPVVIFAPLVSTGNPETFQHYQFWAAVNRAAKYFGDTSATRYKERLFTEDDVKRAKELYEGYLAEGIDFKDIQKRWNKYNNGLVKLMKDTGTISERAARDFTEHGDYFPFYRQVSEEEMTGPKTFSTIAGTKPPKAAKGSEEPLGDFFETVVRNTQAAITLAMKNVAAQRITSQALRINEVVRLSENPQVVQTGAGEWDVYDSQYADTISAANEASALTAARSKYGANATVSEGSAPGKWNVFKPVKIGDVAGESVQEARQNANEYYKYRPSAFAYKVLENGQPVYYQAYDVKLINALKALNMNDLPFIGLLSAPANALRTLVTKEPGYMLVNQMRDSMSAWVTSGVKMTPVVDSARQFARSIAKTSPEMEALFNAGVIGGYEYAHGARESGAFLEKEIRRKAGVKSVTEKIATPFTSLWGALERGTQISDGATRAEVYKRVLAETGNEAEALWQAAEVLNFYRHGRSPVIRVLTAAIPFLNSRIQGLDVLYRAGMRPALDKMSTDEQRQRMKTFWTRGMTMMAVSAMYWMLTHDDDEYKKQEQETRDNYWLIPSLGIKIAIPFEVGVLFKVLPERILQNAFGTDTGKESMESLKRQLQSTLMFTFIPQAFLPYYEVATNFSFFTQRPIIGKGMEDVAPRFQVSPGTSGLAQLIADKLRVETTADSSAFTKSLAKQLEISPIKLDHMIKGYTGTIGQYAVELFDAIYNMNNDVPKPSKRFEQLPIIKRLALDPNARGTVTSYYDLKNSVDEVTRTSNLLERTMNAEQYGSYLRQNIGILANKEYISAMEKSMKELREAKLLIRYSKMDEDRKRDAILSIEKMENQLTSNIQTVRKKAYD